MPASPCQRVPAPGTEPVDRAVLPPARSSFSSTTAVAPPSVAASAAVSPPPPAPTTTTSTSTSDCSGTGVLPRSGYGSAGPQRGAAGLGEGQRGPDGDDGGRHEEPRGGQRAAGQAEQPQADQRRGAA